MHLDDHRADLTAVLTSTKSCSARSVLSLLVGDAIAQIISYVPQKTLDHYFCTLAATSPQMRLDVEVLMGFFADGWGISRTHVEERRMEYKVRMLGRTETNQVLAHSLWWAERCGLPLVLDIDNTCGAHVTILSEKLRNRVAELQIHVSSERDPVCVSEPYCNGECGTLLCALTDLPHVQRLTIMCGMYIDHASVAAGVARALRVAGRGIVNEVQVYGCEQLKNFCTLADSTHLERLTANYCGIRSVEQLQTCPMLTALDISFNDTLEELRGLAGAPNLTRIAAAACGLRNVDGLAACPLLTEVDISQNRSLNDLGGLAGAQCLERVLANQCGLLSVDGLNTCPTLQVLEVRYNSSLSNIAGLAGSPMLMVLDVSGCRVRDTKFLNPCVEVRGK